MKTVNVKEEFYHRLANRNNHQGDGKFNALDFRKKFMSEFDHRDAWSGDAVLIEFDFDGVEKIGPSFANEAFAYFMQYVNPQEFNKRILFKNISRVQKMIIEEELESGYSKK